MSLSTLPAATPTILEPADPAAHVEPPVSSHLSRIYRLTVQQYDRMVEAGILGKRDRVELIEGILVAKMGRNRPHVQAGNKGLRALQRLVGQGWHVRKEDPTVISNLSKPEPDLAVVCGHIEDYDDRDVTVADIALVVEIGDSTPRGSRRDETDLRLQQDSRLSDY